MIFDSLTNLISLLPICTGRHGSCKVQSIALILNPAGQSPQVHLIVCPLSVISNWEKQINDYVNKSSGHCLGGTDREVSCRLEPKQDRRIACLLRYARLGFQELQENQRGRRRL
jgi:hypothetical protein